MENKLLNEEKWYQSITFKMVILGFMVLLLLIPIEVVKKVIRERASYANEAREEIGRSWASAQTITGPVLSVPGKKVINEEGDIATTTLNIMPEKLNANVKIDPEKRSRGIYEAVIFDAAIDLSGEFVTGGYIDPEGYVFDWSKALIVLGVTDNRGIHGELILTLGDLTLNAGPGTGGSDIVATGVSFPADLSLLAAGNEVAPFKISFRLKGSERLFFTPVGKTTVVNLASPWNAPSFQGNFLPDVREISDEGFTASYTVTHLNRSFPQVWKGRGFSPASAAFGVDLFLEVDHYKKSERSAKYGFLFIVITFFVLILAELKSSSRIHIFYYLLVAFALILFFSLLNALSEHLGFNPAYLIASAATIGLLSIFFVNLLEKRWIVLLVSGTLTTLYLFIFILLALKEYSYLAGNIGLFIMLSVMMLVSARQKLFKHEQR